VCYLSIKRLKIPKVKLEAVNQRRTGTVKTKEKGEKEK
jgi:hypothetical protein